MKNEGMLRRAARAQSLVLALTATVSTISPRVAAQSRAPYLSDRGPGVASSMWATFLERNELIVYPFFVYSQDHNREYKASDFGFGPGDDLTGRFRMTESQLFLAYGLSDRIGLELEAGYLSARLDKSSSDMTAMPARLEQSGFGDIEAQIRFRILREGFGRPEVFGYMEITAPSNRSRGLIGDEDWDYRPGVGIVRGFDWGTLLSRVTIEYNREGKHLDLGEFAIMFLRQVNPSFRVHFSVEGGEGGAPDEWELISGIQWRRGRHVVLRFDNTLGVSPKATDWAPQVGVMLIVPR